MKIENVIGSTIPKILLKEARMGAKDLATTSSTGYTFGMEAEVYIDFDEFAKLQFEEVKDEQVSEFLERNKLERTEENVKEAIDDTFYDFNMELKSEMSGPEDHDTYEIEEYLQNKNYSSQFISAFNENNGYDGLNSVFQINQWGNKTNLTPTYGFVYEDEEDNDIIYANEEKTERVDLSKAIYNVKKINDIFDLFDESFELSDAFSEYLNENNEWLYAEIQRNFTPELNAARILFKDLIRKKWIIVADGSLGNGGAELVSPVYDSYEKFKSDLESVFSRFNQLNELGILYGSNKTGFHVNIGNQKWKNNSKPFDLFKFLLLTHEKYVLNQFGRMYNSYSSEKLSQPFYAFKHDLKLDAVQKTEKVIKELIDKMNENLWTSRDRKFIDTNKISQGQGYIELRAQGGEDYFKNVKLIETTVLRYLRAFDIAQNEASYKKEYYKKIYNSISRGGPYVEPDKENKAASNFKQRLAEKTGLLIREFFNKFDTGGITTKNPDITYTIIKAYQAAIRNNRDRPARDVNSYEAIIGQYRIIHQVILYNILNDGNFGASIDVNLIKTIFKNIKLLFPTLSIITPDNLLNKNELTPAEDYSLFSLLHMVGQTNYSEIFRKFTEITGIQLHTSGINP